jgi:hypothetical protein
MGRPTENGDRITTALRLPVDLHARLHAAAEEREVAVNWLICRLLAEGLDRLIPVSELLLTRADTREGEG